MATRAAARAPASAAALPPPGVGLGPASSWIQSSRPGPRLARIFASSRWSVRSEHLSHAAAAPMTARSGMRPTTSLFRIPTPRRRASASTAANTVAGGTAADTRAQTLELPLAQGGEALALRPRGGSRVQIHGNRQLAPHPLGEGPRQGDAVGHRDVAQRDERHYVRRPHSRVLSLM